MWRMFLHLLMPGGLEGQVRLEPSLHWHERLVEVDDRLLDSKAEDSGDFEADDRSTWP